MRKKRTSPKPKAHKGRKRGVSRAGWPAQEHHHEVLTSKQERFVAEYLKDSNATQAAQRVGYSRQTAYSQGQRLLKNVEIARRIADGHARQLASAELTAERTLEEIRRLSTLDPIHIFDEHGNLRHVKDMPPEVRACIASVKVLKINTKSGDGIIDTVYEVKFWDKTKALEMSAKHFSLLVEQIRLSGSLTYVNETASDDELLAQIEAILTKARARKESDVPA